MSGSNRYTYPARRAFGFSSTQMKSLESLLDYFRDNFEFSEPNIVDGTFTTPTLVTPTSTDGTFTTPTLDTPTITSPVITGGTVASKDVVSTKSADGAITIQGGTVKITKAGVALLTLAAPSAGQEGTVIRVVSNTANAHTITATGLIEDGVTGGAKDTATFAAFAGASITLVAINLKWSVLALNAVTIS